MRLLLQSWGERFSLRQQPELHKNIGSIRDALFILIIVAAGMYLLENPDKFDAFLNWMSSRHTSSVI